MPKRRDRFTWKASDLRMVKNGESAVEKLAKNVTRQDKVGDFNRRRYVRREG